MERAKSLKEKSKDKKGLILRTLKRCKSLGNMVSGTSTRAMHAHKKKPWPRVAPEGYVTVYVGPEKERFVIRTECVNHPIFKDLLDEALSVYGYASAGPIELPCDVGRFYQVLCEINERDEEVVSSLLCSFPASPVCGHGKGHVGYRVLNPSPFVIAGWI